MSRVRFSNKAARVEHERVVGSSLVRLNFGKDRVQQIGVMNSCIKNVGRRPPYFTRNQREPGLRVNRRLVLRENDQRRPRLIEPGIHP